MCLNGIGASAICQQSVKAEISKDCLLDPFHKAFKIISIGKVLMFSLPYCFKDQLLLKSICTLCH